MKKPFSTLGLVMALALVSGCTLYFGPDDDDDRYYSYCDETGCYTCDNETGQCWSDGGGWGCYSDYDCAAGCYCDENSGTCVEAGFCSDNGECPEGYYCDDRASCVPDGSQSCWETGCAWGYYCDQWSGECVPSTTCQTAEECGPGYDCVNGTCTPVGCTSDDQCAAGCYCDEQSGGCVESGYCTQDADCAGLNQVCDEDRGTCVPVDETPPPLTCEDLTDEAACIARDDCIPTYTGINCTNQDGSACESGDTGCTCESFVFAACVTAAAP